MGLSPSSLMSYEEARQCLPGDESQMLEAHIDRLVDVTSGIVSLEALVNDSAHLPRVLLEHFYRKLNEDGNSPLTPQVLFRAIASLRTGDPEAREKAMFSIFDLDGDGYWNEKEADYYFAMTTIPRPSTTVLGQKSDKISFEQYKSWLGSHKLAPFSKMAMSDEVIPVATLNEVLAGVTGFSKRDIGYLQGQYHNLLRDSSTGKLDQDSFICALKSILPREMSSTLFDMFDTNQDGQIDFRELASGLSILTHGDINDKLKLCLEPAFETSGSITEVRLISVLSGIWRATYIFNHQSDILQQLASEVEANCGPKKQNRAKRSNTIVASDHPPPILTSATAPNVCAQPDGKTSPKSDTTNHTSVHFPHKTHKRVNEHSPTHTPKATRTGRSPSPEMKRRPNALNHQASTASQRSLFTSLDWLTSANQNVGKATVNAAATAQSSNTASPTLSKPAMVEVNVIASNLIVDAGPVETPTSGLMAEDDTRIFDVTKASSALRNRHSICGPIVDSADLGTMNLFIADCKASCINESGEIDLEQLTLWASKTPVLVEFIQTLSKIGPVVFGVRPNTKTKEAIFVMQEMDNHLLRGLVRGATVYVISADWWEAWQTYTDATNLMGAPMTSNSGILLGAPGPIDNSSLIADEDGLDFTISVSPNQKSTWQLPDMDLPGSSSSSTEDTKRRPSVKVKVLGKELKEKTEKKWFGLHTKPKEPSKKPPPPTPPAAPAAAQIPTTTKAPEEPVLEPPRSFNSAYKNRLKWNLVQNQDYVLVPYTVWRVLRHWYTSQFELERPIIPAGINNMKLEVELYPLVLYVLVYSSRNNSDQTTGLPKDKDREKLTNTKVKSPGHSTSELKLNIQRSMVKFSMNVSKAASTQQLKADILDSYASLKDGLVVPPQNARIWNFYNANRITLLHEATRLDDNDLIDRQAVMLEIRDTDSDNWPCEVTASSDGNRSFFHSRTKSNVDVPVVQPGLTGLQNLGNTCFMNAAIQCLSHTAALTTYFLSGYHKVELNPDGALSCQGMIARSYGNIIRRLWTGMERSVAPVKLKKAIGKFSPQFNGSQQHDSHELLSFMLDGLHEDLNRVTKKPYVELADSNGRANSAVAAEYWDAHKSRNNSIITDVFHGMLHNQTRCLECGHENVRFDPFSYLTLPLPSENNIYVEVVVVKLDGTTPIMYGVNVSKKCTNRELKNQIEALAYISKHSIILLETSEGRVVGYVRDSDLVKPSIHRSTLHAYEVHVVANNEKLDAEHAESPFTHAVPFQVPQTAPITKESTDSLTGPQEALGKTKSLKKRDWRPSFSYLTSGSSKTNPLSTKATQGNHNSITSTQTAKGPLTSTTKSGTSLLKRSQSQTNPTARGMSLKKPASPTAKALTAAKAKASTTGSLNLDKPLQTIHAKSGKDDSKPASLNLKTQKVRPVSDPEPGAQTPQPHAAIAASISTLQPTVHGYFLIAMHRVCDMPDLLVPGNLKPRCLGRPMMLSFSTALVTHKELYAAVDDHMGRYVNLSAYRKKDANERTFQLKRINRDGTTCSECEWYKLCDGCVIDQDTPEATIHIRNLKYIAINWDVSAYYLYFNADLESHVTTDNSVKASAKQQNTSIQLMDCVSEFNTRDRLENDEAWYCPVCKKSQVASKSLSMWSLPKVLIVHLKRFHYINGRWVKNAQPVEFPIHDLSLPTLCPDQSSKTYSLFAVANHSGALGGGHYTTFAKNYRTSEWHHYNDDKVTPAKKSDLVSSKAYYLFYAQDGINPHDLLPTDIQPQEFTTEWLDANDLAADIGSPSLAGLGIVKAGAKTTSASRSKSPSRSNSSLPWSPKEKSKTGKTSSHKSDKEPESSASTPKTKKKEKDKDKDKETANKDKTSKSTMTSRSTLSKSAGHKSKGSSDKMDGKASYTSEDSKSSKSSAKKKSVLNKFSTSGAGANSVLYKSNGSPRVARKKSASFADLGNAVDADGNKKTLLDAGNTTPIGDGKGKSESSWLKLNRNGSSKSEKKPEKDKEKCRNQ